MRSTTKDVYRVQESGTRSFTLVAAIRDSKHAGEANFIVIMGKRKENKGAEVGVKLESTEFESKGAEDG